MSVGQYDWLYWLNHKILRWGRQSLPTNWLCLDLTFCRLQFLMQSALGGKNQLNRVSWAALVSVGWNPCNSLCVSIL
jgi:hypothetical protein